MHTVKEIQLAPPAGLDLLTIVSRPQAARNPSYFLSRDAGGILSLHHKGSAGVIYVGVKGKMGHARQPGAEGSWRDRQLPLLCVSVRALYFLVGPFPSSLC